MVFLNNLATQDNRADSTSCGGGSDGSGGIPASCGGGSGGDGGIPG